MHRLTYTLFLLLFAVIAYADRGIGITAKSNRIALVIGNASYKVGPLKNSVNDANDMASVLKQKGFSVILLTNATQRQMEKAIGQFGKQLRNAGVGLFFYGGHGMQVDGINYLIPIEANIEAESDIKYESVNANRILSKMQEAENSLNMVFLDACRNNPFARSFRSPNKGLATMDAPSGSLLAFATAPGKTAADGDGRNGLFTSQLLIHMQTPGLPLTKMMMEVRKGVLRESEDKQTPWDVSSLTGDFYFSGEGKITQVILKAEKKQFQPTKSVQEEDQFWDMIKNSSDYKDFEGYLKRYPNGKYETIASFKYDRLKEQYKIDNQPTNTGAHVFFGLSGTSLFLFYTISSDDNKCDGDEECSESQEGGLRGFGILTVVFGLLGWQFYESLDEDGINENKSVNYDFHFGLKPSADFSTLSLQLEKRW
jgi:uncharacterized caspase-like protein